MYFWDAKPHEELYDLELDPDETQNLASSEEHQEALVRFRRAVDEHILSTRVTGFLSENEIHSRSNGRALLGSAWLAHAWQASRGHQPAGATYPPNARIEGRDGIMMERSL